MKKIFISLLAVAAIAACTKSEVQYDEPAEIGFAPATKNITKAEGLSGNLGTSQELGIWAYWDKDGNTGAVQDYVSYNDSYLANALFAHKNGSWGGSPNGYPWPVNGALVFAGYTTPGDGLLSDKAVSYDFGNDIMFFTDYENTSEFDLCWFGRTATSFNYRADGTAVPVELSHALSWITINVVGEGTPVNSWKITSMSLSKVATKGTAKCEGNTKKATWSNTTLGNKEIYTGDATILATSSKLTDNILIPSDDVQLTVNFTFPVGDKTKNDSVVLTLNNDTWESGIHYIYTLSFKGNEILVAPSYGNWGDGSNSTITVQ